MTAHHAYSDPALHCGSSRSDTADLAGLSMWFIMFSDSQSCGMRKFSRHEVDDLDELLPDLLLPKLHLHAPLVQLLPTPSGP